MSVDRPLSRPLVVVKNAAQPLLYPLARPLVRSALYSTSALTRFGINGVEAALALDFIGGEYRTANTSTTFADAFTGTSPKLTYSTAAGSNSTMTQGYGPELVTNGGFDTDTDWSKGTGWTISGGVATKAAGLSSVLEQLDVVPSSGRVSVTFDATRTAGVLYVRAGGNTNQASVSASGSYEFILDAQGVDTKLRFVADGSFAGTIANISVREAPKIVWAPHNLVPYSEDFSQWDNQNSAVTVSADEAASPSGTTTADKATFTFNGDYGSSATALRLNLFSTPAAKSAQFKVWAKQAPSGSATHLRLTSNNISAWNTGGSVKVALTDEWQLVSLDASVSGTTNLRVLIGILDEAGNVDTDCLGAVLLWGAHLYRSDLGGMHPVPGAVGDFQYYVPTNGSAEYLPRVGHHVYNGSTWVNEGLLIESEPRTNLFPTSTITAVGYGTDWDGSGSGNGSSVSVAASVAAPDGTTGAVGNFVADASTTTAYLAKDVPVTPGVTYTQSVYAKPNGTNFLQIAPSTGFASEHYNFDLVNLQTSSNSGATGTASVEDAGNEWVRCSVTVTSTSTTSIGRMVFAWINSFTAARLDSDAGGAPNGTDGVYLWGAQLEQGQVVNGTPVDAPTPSSYMPTSGGTYTRTAQSLTVPPAEFGWPEPEYIGPELVDNGDFSLGDNGDWIAGGLDGSSITFNSGVARLYGNALAYQTIPTVAGRVYYAQFEITDATISGASDFRVGTSANGIDIYDQTPNVGVGSYSVAFVATSSTTFITLKTHYTTGDLSRYTDFDNISVREINPLSVSIQMDGRMTYADEDVSAQQSFYRWRLDVGNRINTDLYTNSTNEGTILFDQFPSSGAVPSSGEVLTPGVNVPFNISSRHGSTFVNGAVDGVALTANTTPTALPDLSSTNLQIAYDFMGTIGTFRQFAGDIGDTGLVTATNPSTEPTLSLTFDGTGGSFYNLSWSE